MFFFKLNFEALLTTKGEKVILNNAFCDPCHKSNWKIFGIDSPKFFDLYAKTVGICNYLIVY